MEDNLYFSVQQSRRPTGTRRRTRSTGSLPWGKFSAESSSSMGEWDMSRNLAGMPIFNQSDSDDVNGLFHLPPSRFRRLFSNIESDSVNENFSPIKPTTRRGCRLVPASRSRSILKLLHRKRKLKRMAMDVEVASSSRPYSCQTSTALGSKKKRILRHGSNCENRFCSGSSSGKRKRSARSLTDPPRTVLALHRLSLKDDNQNHNSSSSLSSSESDPGIYTNDEGREGDDEQSDWVWDGARAGGWSEEVEVSEAAERQASLLLALASSSLSLAPRHRNTAPIPPVTKGGREIQMGNRRRFRNDRPSVSALTFGERLARYLPKPHRSQLRLQNMREQERDQMKHLAELYSIDLDLVEESAHSINCPLLSKSRTAVRGSVCTTGTTTTGENKRRRFTPPSTDTTNTQDMSYDSIGDEESLSLPIPGSDSDMR